MDIQSRYIAIALMVLTVYRAHGGLMGYRGMENERGKIVDIYADNHILGSGIDNAKQLKAIEKSISQRKAELPKIDVLYEGRIKHVDSQKAKAMVDAGDSSSSFLLSLSPVTVITRFPFIDDRLTSYANFTNVETRLGVLEINAYLSVLFLRRLELVLKEYGELKFVNELLSSSLSALSFMEADMKHFEEYTYGDLLKGVVNLRADVDTMVVKKFENEQYEKKFEEIREIILDDLDDAIDDFSHNIDTGIIDAKKSIMHEFDVRFDELITDFKDSLVPQLRNIMLLEDNSRSVKEKITDIATSITVWYTTCMLKLGSLFRRKFLKEACSRTLDLKVLSHIVDASTCLHSAVFVGAAHADRIYRDLLDLGYTLREEVSYKSNAGISYDIVEEAVKDRKNCRLELNADIVIALMALVVSGYTKLSLGSSSKAPYEEIMNESILQIVSNLFTQANCYFAGDLALLEDKYFSSLSGEGAPQWLELSSESHDDCDFPNA